VNTDTLNLIERPYAEVVDDLLTAIVGGVVNEPIIFDVKVLLYILAETATDIRGITGTIRRPNSSQNEHFTFQKTVDFGFDQGKNAVVWLDGGTQPQDDTVFYVDYFRSERRSPLTDINVGSVTRTLSEAIGREIATVYQQINLAYLSGFIDTAQGKSLDFVVAILGVVRKTKEFAIGFVTLFRDPAVDGNITIPQEASLATTKGTVTFHTTEPRTLQRGQARIDVPIRADDAFGGDKGIVKAGEITNLALRIAGIARVTNFEPTILAAQDESDDRLRLRAKAALRGLGKATLAALRQAIFENRATLDEVSDPNTLNGKASSPGTVNLLVNTEPGRFPSLQAAVNETRAAGVLTTLVARFVFFEPHITAKITPNLTGPGKDKIKNDIITALQSYVEGLKNEELPTGAGMLKAIAQVKDVSSSRIVDVRAWRSDIGQPGSDPLVEALVTSLQGVNAQDPDALRTAISGVISAEAPALLPSGRRIPDRTLIMGMTDDGKPAGQPATDGQIESGKFQIVPPAQFSVVIDMDTADIALQDS
jgi:hypothetical protein